MPLVPLVWTPVARPMPKLSKALAESGPKLAKLSQDHPFIRAFFCDESLAGGQVMLDHVLPLLYKPKKNKTLLAWGPLIGAFSSGVLGCGPFQEALLVEKTDHAHPEVFKDLRHFLSTNPSKRAASIIYQALELLAKSLGEKELLPPPRRSFRAERGNALDFLCEQYVGALDSKRAKRAIGRKEAEDLQSFFFGYSDCLYACRFIHSASYIAYRESDGQKGGHSLNLYMKFTPPKADLVLLNLPSYDHYLPLTSMVKNALAFVKKGGALMVRMCDGGLKAGQSGISLPFQIGSHCGQPADSLVGGLEEELPGAPMQFLSVPVHYWAWDNHSLCTLLDHLSGPQAQAIAFYLGQHPYILGNGPEVFARDDHYIIVSRPQKAVSRRFARLDKIAGSAARFARPRPPSARSARPRERRAAWRSPAARLLLSWSHSARPSARRPGPPGRPHSFFSPP